MREDDEIQHFAPLLRRIIVVVAVMTAVPVMLWTATAFMHRYVMPPQMPWTRSTASAQATTAAANPNPAQPAPPVVEASAATADTRGVDISAKTDRPPDGSGTAAAVATPAKSNVSAPSQGNNAALTAAPPTVATADVTGSVPPAPAASPAAIAPYTTADASTAMPDAAPGSAANSAVPAQPAAAQAASSDDAANGLPAPDPLAGPVPLPRHRPSEFALAETGPVPLPRVRPAGGAESSPSVGHQQSGYDPAMAHY